MVTRHNANTHKSVILVARTAFYPLDVKYAVHLEPLRIEGKFEKILFEIKMSGQPDDQFKRAADVINGYTQFHSEVTSILDPHDSQMIDLEVLPESSINLIKFKSFSPSSVIVFTVGLLDNQQKALDELNDQLKQFSGIKSNEIFKIVNDLDLLDLNYVLFRCNQEESDETGGNGVYNISSGPFVYSGLAGIMYHLVKIRTHNDLGT